MAAQNKILEKYRLTAYGFRWRLIRVSQLDGGVLVLGILRYELCYYVNTRIEELMAVPQDLYI